MSLPAYFVHSSAKMLGGLVGGVHGFAILAKGVSQMVMAARTSEGRKALIYGRMKPAEEVAAVVPVGETMVEKAAPIVSSRDFSPVQEEKPFGIRLQSFRRSNSSMAMATGTGRETYQAKMRRMKEEIEAGRVKHEFRMRNLRQLRTAEEQRDFLEFISTPATPPPRDLSQWQTSHAFHSADSIRRVVRCLGPAFDAAAPQQ